MSTIRNLFAPGEIFGSLRTPLPVTRIQEKAEEFEAPPPRAVDLTPKKPDEAPDRILFVSQNGDLWSYPYSHMGLIESPTPEEIIIQGGCQVVENIVLYGQNLEQLMADLNAHTVREIIEGSDAKGWVVDQITVIRRPTDNATPEEPPNE